MVSRLHPETIMISPYKVLWGWTSRGTGAKQVQFLFVFFALFITFLNDKVCEHDIAIKPFELGNNYDIVG